MASTGSWRNLLKWYEKHGRRLPWRGADDYCVAVSEFMLQQTQVDRVIPLFRRFMARFPSWQALAGAEQADVVRAWKGLGYNLRAIRLRELAREVTERHGGRLPSDEPSLLALKGVGPYTARALRVFVHKNDLLAPDTNVRRVMTRLRKGPIADPQAVDWNEWRRWEASIPKGAGHDLNQALMDLGSAVCRAGMPDCGGCPLMRGCASWPEILSTGRSKIPAQKTRRKERTDEFGIPNRIYRGRIIDRLRAGAIKEAQFEDLGRAVRTRFSKRDVAWLRSVLEGLKRDGLVRIEDDLIRLA